jgi:hypothetical protein
MALAEQVASESLASQLSPKENLASLVANAICWMSYRQAVGELVFGKLKPDDRSPITLSG